MSANIYGEECQGGRATLKTKVGLANIYCQELHVLSGGGGATPKTKVELANIPGWRSISAFNGSACCANSAACLYLSVPAQLSAYICLCWPSCLPISVSASPAACLYLSLLAQLPTYICLCWPSCLPISVSASQATFLYQSLPAQLRAYICLCWLCLSSY